MKSSLEVAREIRFAISNHVSVEYTKAQIDELTEKVRKPLVEALERMFQVHILHCRICAGPDDGCDEGQRLEQIKLAALAQCKQP